MGVQQPVKRTVVTMRDYAGAMLRAWRRLSMTLPSKESIAVLWAQYMIETGGKACWNWNIGNVKHVQGDGYDWIALSGVWEGVTPAAAHELVTRGFAVYDTSEEHKKAVGAGKVSVVFLATHPASRFRAYPSLTEAMNSHLDFLKKRYERAWAEIEKGDYRAFAKRLKEGRDGKENTADDYYTASSEAYAKGMSYHFASFIGSKVYDEERALLLSSMDAPTLPSVNTDIPPTMVPPSPIDFPVVRPPVPMPERCPRCMLMSCNGDCPLV